MEKKTFWDKKIVVEKYSHYFKDLVQEIKNDYEENFRDFNWLDFSLNDMSDMLYDYFTEIRDVVVEIIKIEPTFNFDNNWDIFIDKIYEINFSFNNYTYWNLWKIKRTYIEKLNYLVEILLNDFGIDINKY